MLGHCALLEEFFLSIPASVYVPTAIGLVVAISALMFRYRSGSHAKTWLELYGDTMPDADYDSKRETLKTRATVPYHAPGAYGTDLHFLFGLAAVWNERRLEGKPMIGGFHDNVKLVDPDIGPVLMDDTIKLHQVMSLARIEGGTDLWRTLTAILVCAVDGSQPHPLQGVEWPEYQHGTLKNDGSRIPGFEELEIHMLAYSIHLCRIGATIGWLGETRALEYLLAARDALTPRLAEVGSWREYGRIIIRCENYYDGAFQPVDPAAIAISLKRLDKERHSPWKKMPFKMPPHTTTLPEESELV